MSAKKSNLSQAGYQYDLVSALSQDALNINLIALLRGIEDKELPPITEYYKYIDPMSHGPADEEWTILMTPEEVEEMTGGANIFDMPDGIDSETNNSTIKALGDAMFKVGFAYALEATIGPLRNMPDMIFLHNTNACDPQQTVTFNTFFKTFKILRLIYGSADSWTVQQSSQETSTVCPWVFEWEVDLNLSLPSNVDFNSLPENVQKTLKNVKNLDTTTMFSMQQLYLDLNTPQLINTTLASVVHFPPGDYTVLSKFISNYWVALKENGGLIFQTSVKPITNNYPPSSIIPTDLNFMVSPYSDATKQGLSTLNYLIMSDGRKMPAIQPFKWDWVDDVNPQGIMSVRRDVFVDYLNKALSPALRNICRSPIIEANMNGQYILNFGSPYEVTYNKNPGNEVLTFSFGAFGDDDAGLGLLFSAKIDLRVNSIVTFSNNKIICTTEISMYAKIYTALATTEGYATATRNITTFTMESVGSSRDNGGILSISTEVENIDLLQKGGKKKTPYYRGNLDDPSWWTEGITLGAINDYLKVLSRYSSTLDNFMTDYNKDIVDIMTNCLGWVFPGANTYTYYNPKFSDNQDLTVEIAVQSFE